MSLSEKLGKRSRRLTLAPKMIPILSNIAFSLFALGYFPIFLSKLKQAEDPKKLWQDRIGNLDPTLFQKKDPSTPLRTGPSTGSGQVIPRIWVHAVSVGEVKAVEPFLTILKERGCDIFLTTVTPTGQKEAQKFLPGKCFYFPFDLTFAVQKALKVVRPDLILLAETELWPNFITEAARIGIPVGVINGRLSKRSFERYQWILPLMSVLLNKLSFIFAQTKADADRLIGLGAAPEKVQILGNMKFDIAPVEGLPEPAILKKYYRISPAKKVWVAGSTHPGEEEKVFTVFTRLRSVFHDLVVVVAPRHIERAQDIEVLARNFNFRAIRLTQLEKSYNRDFDVLIIDTIGELKKIYSFADVVWMGGSFVTHGGQNPIEPALFAKPIFSGPHIFNFEFVYGELEKNQAVVMVHAEDELFVKLKEFLNNPLLSSGFGQRAQATVTRLAGASLRTADKVEEYLRQSHCEERERRSNPINEIASLRSQ